MSVEVDLHLHSDCSDGQFPPAEVVRQASLAGLKAMALTDHDTVDGLAEAIRAAPPGLEVIPGAELSSEFRGREIHLLAYYLRYEDGFLSERLEPLRAGRLRRAEQMVVRLNSAGLAITLDDVLAAVRSGEDGPMSLGRPHVAEALVKRGHATDMDDAFRRYLRAGQPGFVSKAALPAEEAIQLAHTCGGAVVLAHPALNLSDADVDALIPAGLDGIEVFHPKQNEAQRKRLGAIARRHRILLTGGSDYHGPQRSRHPMATCGVTLETAHRLKLNAES